MRYDETLLGTVKEFLNGWKVVFERKGAYYLQDPFGNSEHFCSYTKRMKMFEFIKFKDKELNYGSKKQIGEILSEFTGKINVWNR